MFPKFISTTVYWNSEPWLYIFSFLLKNQEKKINFLQKKISHYLNSSDFLPTNTGSTAIKLALKAFKQLFPSKKEVILPIYICPSVVKAIIQVGLLPKFIGIERNLNLSISDLKYNLNQNILAVIIPHIYGYPAPIREAIDIIKDYEKSIFMIDDAASAFGIKKSKEFLGTFGDVGIISFTQAKMLTSSWGGGLIVNNQLLLPILNKIYERFKKYKKMEKLKEFINFFWLYKLRRYSEIIDWGFQKTFGKSLGCAPKTLKEERKMSELDAMIILDQISKIDLIHKKRQKIMSFYMKELSRIPQISFPQPNAPLYHVSRFCILTNGFSVKRKNKKIFSHNPLVYFLRKRGIRAEYGYYPFNYFNLTKWEEIKWIESLVVLPIDLTKTVEEHKFVTNNIKKFFS